MPTLHASWCCFGGQRLIHLFGLFLYTVFGLACFIFCMLSLCRYCSFFFIFIFICMLTCRNTYMLLNWELIKFGDGKKYVCSFVKLSRYMDFLMYIAIPFLITVAPYIFGKNYENIIHVMNWFLPLWDWHFLFFIFFLHHIYFFLKLCWNVNFSCIISDWVIFILKTNFIKTKIYILSKIVLNGILILLHYRVGMYLNNNILKCVL